MQIIMVCEQQSSSRLYKIPLRHFEQIFIIQQLCCALAWIPRRVSNLPINFPRNQRAQRHEQTNKQTNMSGKFLFSHFTPTIKLFCTITQTLLIDVLPVSISCFRSHIIMLFINYCTTSDKAAQVERREIHSLFRRSSQNKMCLSQSIHIFLLIEPLIKGVQMWCLNNN